MQTLIIYKCSNCADLEPGLFGHHYPVAGHQSVYTFKGLVFVGVNATRNHHLPFNTLK